MPAVAGAAGRALCPAEPAILTLLTETSEDTLGGEVLGMRARGGPRGIILFVRDTWSVKTTEEGFSASGRGPVGTVTVLWRHSPPVSTAGII